MKTNQNNLLINRHEYEYKKRVQVNAVHCMQSNEIIEIANFKNHHQG